MVNHALLLVLAHLSASPVWSLQAGAYPKDVDDIGSAAAAGMAFKVDRAGTHFQALAADEGLVVVGDALFFQIQDYEYISVGAAYIFDTRRGGQPHSIQRPDGDAPAEFGASVAIDGDVVVVGAPLRDEQRGGAYIFDTSGTLASVLLASDGAAGDAFGEAIAINKGRIAVGAVHKDKSAGCVYMFNTDGQQLRKVTAEDASEGDDFGRKIALDEGNLVVAAVAAARVYIFDGEGKEQVAAVDSPEAGGDAQFGRDVGVANGRIAIASSESVWIFDESGEKVAEIPPAAEGLKSPTLATKEDDLVVVYSMSDAVYLFNTRGQQLGKIESESHPETVAIDASSGLLVVGSRAPRTWATSYEVHQKKCGW